MSRIFPEFHGPKMPDASQVADVRVRDELDEEEDEEEDEDKKENDDEGEDDGYSE